MPTLSVFDPALCCSTGVCGPEVDESLVRFAADVEWLKARGVEVRRFNLSQEPSVFASDALVRQTLQSEGVECLPLLVLDGVIVGRGAYPARADLSRITGVAAAGSRPQLRMLPLEGGPVQGCTPDSGCC